jgi:acyl-CoA dehydrogenase
MILLDPNQLDRAYPDERSAEIMRKTVGFFEAKGKEKLLADYYERPWYADFLEFVKKERIFASMCTPEGEGAQDARWDTWRICEFAEILGFYGLQYWYTWQVSVLGLGPIWRHLRLRAVREDPRRRHLLHRHGAHPRRRRLARQRTQVLHRQRQRSRHRLDLRALRGR